MNNTTSVMKTLTIHLHPERWGNSATDAKAARWAAQMGAAAREAGFKFDCVEASGTTDVAWLYSLNWNADEADAAESGEFEIDWFSRWCSHGFRGMVGWLKKECK